MKAVLMTSPGTPEVLQVQQVTDPIIENDREILVSLKAAGVNPIDTKLRTRGTLYPDQMPAILGCDGAGIVKEIGKNVQKFQVGDEVYFCNSGIGLTSGNYAELAVVDERFVAKKPTCLSFVEAAAAPLILITAWESLYDRGNLQPGRKVLIHGGAGGVGHVAIQLAKLQGAEVATTISSEEKADFVKKLGADLTIFKDTNFVETILDWTDGEGVDLAFDTIGGKVFYDTIPAVKVYGDLVTILEPNYSLGNLKIARQRNLRISLELMLTPMMKGLTEAQEDQAKILQQCGRLFEQGKLKISVNKTFALDDAIEAHRMLEGGSMIGKIVLTI
ncbi:zinc-dependent alcohol dehydrogenase family protein [Okeania sp.]|uniref:zinc-dependent alcohol dehydrogenase family protein n=1 Tax=Okeania sp. TaxID=3100323 RepID=UPI002B4ABF47|nr:zinc-dependent alcohol dehydrogenase family protein [Okeania sp.]MEB3340787.1 zinc-dependent alcohol dehydrogenase family protein [Okeania sp.]